MRYSHQMLCASSIALGLLISSRGMAEDFYNGRSVRLVVGTSAGGGADITARLCVRLREENATMNCGTMSHHFVRRQAAIRFLP